MKPRSLQWIALCIALAMALAPVTGFAKPKKSKETEAAAEKPDKPFQEWKKVTKDAEVQRGLFTLHRKRESLYLELAPDQLDKPVLGVWSIARGIGRDLLLGGLSILNDRMIEFHRSGDHILVLDKNTRFVAPAGSAIEKAKDMSFGNSVLASLKIESEHDSTKAVLVDIAPFLVSDVSDIGEVMRGAFGDKPVRFDKERSALTTLKAYPENVEIEALLTYTPTDRDAAAINTIPDDRYVPITMHYSFSKLPESPMSPRLADDRTGYFLSVVKDFSRDDKEHFWRRYVNRWRLEKKDPSAALSEPVKPIVFYVDRTVPEKYRAFVKQGIEAWQPAFEAAGFKNAIIAKDPGDDPDYDPGDVRYSTIRWITSSIPSFGAIGPSRVDPRTGEILDADILFEASIVQRRWSVYNNLVGPTGTFEMPWMRTDASPLPAELRCDAAAGASAGMTLAHLATLMDGSAEPGSPIHERFVGEMLVHTVLHEVGHSLGLTHNFRASTATPADKLNDPTWTRENGMMASVMDYATPNVSRDRAAQGDYYGRYPGTADTWMIRYGYTPSGAQDEVADYTFVEKIAQESNLPGHAYSPDPDTYGPNALDPRSNIWDLGNDPLVFAKDRCAWVSEILNDDKLEERVLGASGEYPVLRRAVDGLMQQYAIGLGLAVKYVGGQYQSRTHRGQADGREPLQPVPALRQREALDFLGECAFSTTAFSASPKLLNRLAPDRWSHWGVNDNFSTSTGPRLDYNLGDKAVAIQSGILNALLAPSLLARLREAENRAPDAFRVVDLFGHMTRMLWGEVGGTDPAAIKTLEGPHTRREVQRTYVDLLGQMVVAPPQGLPDDARALARLQLERIDARSARALRAETPLGDVTRAHLLETRARIERALKAEASAAVGRPRGGPGGAAAE